MRNDNTGSEPDRRTFLQFIGALGASMAATTVSPPVRGAESMDGYYTTLQSTLTASSRQQRQLPEGTFLLGTTESTVLDSFTVAGAGETERIAVDDDSVPHTTGVRLTATDRSSPLRFRATVSDSSVSVGDRLLAVVWVRSDDPHSTATTTFGYAPSETEPVRENFVQRGATIGPTGEWMRYFAPIEIERAPAASETTTALEFTIDAGTRSIDLGGIALLSYSESDVSLSTLPPYDYAGRSENASWRDSAQERIETHRKTDVEIEIRNPGGQPMNDATVTIEQVAHDFDFGSAVSVDEITGDEPANEQYRDVFEEHFNAAVIENGMKHPAWEGNWDIDTADTWETLDWLGERSISTRGHYLLWEEFETDGGGGMSIENADSLSGDELSARIEQKIAAHAERFGDAVVNWDMHNHPIWQSNFRDDDDDGLDWSDLRTWWEAANNATDQGLYTNEMGVVGGAWQRSQYYDFVSRLVAEDFPLDGIAFMAHHQQQWNQLLDVETIVEGFEEFSAFGLPLVISEFDIEIFDRRNAQDVAVQADYTRDFLTIAFSMPAVESIISWGFWAGDHWRPTGAYYDTDWTLRPNGDVYQRLVFDEWWTETTAETDSDGRVSTSVFDGDYRITASKGALSGETTVTIDDDTDVVTVDLRPPGRH